MKLCHLSPISRLCLIATIVGLPATLHAEHYIVAASLTPGALGEMNHEELLAFVQSRVPGVAPINGLFLPRVGANFYVFDLTQGQAILLRNPPNPQILVERDDHLVPMNNGNPGPPAATWALSKMFGTATPTLPTDCLGCPEIYIVDSGIVRTHAEFNTPRLRFLLPGIVPVGLAVDPYQDQLGHGTAVASCVAGLNTGTLLRFTNSSASIISCRIYDNFGSASISDAIEVIYRAADRHLDAWTDNILGNEGGVLVFTSRIAFSPINPLSGYSTILENALYNAWVRGMLTTVCACGNETNPGIPVAGQATSPSGISPGLLPPANAWAMPYLTMVAASDCNDARWANSNYGIGTSLFAPGVSVQVAVAGGGLAQRSGTSYATGYVGGLAAAYLANHPWASPNKVHNHLVANAVGAIPVGSGPNFGFRPRVAVGSGFVVPPSACYDVWANECGLLGTQPTDDSDGDQLSNLLEFHLGSHPRIPHWFKHFYVENGTLHTYRSILYDCGLTDVSYDMEESANLSSWGPSVAIPLLPSAGNYHGLGLKLTGPIPTAPPTKRFFRIKLTKNLPCP